MKQKDTLVVFTARSPNRIIKEGGSQAWKLNPSSTKKCKWIICTQNRHNKDHEFSDATQEHCEAFLLGKVAGVERSTEQEAQGRWIVKISEYALINIPEFWKGWRNPVHYLSIEDITNLKTNEIKFSKISKNSLSSVEKVILENNIEGLSIDQAKQGLAITFGVKPEAVEIVIRG